VYLRHTVVRKGGRAHTYWRLVRSVRRGGRVVQETVAHLGELDGEGRARARLLAQEITGRGDQRELFEEPATVEPTVAVRLKGLRVERGRAMAYLALIGRDVLQHFVMIYHGAFRAGDPVHLTPELRLP
jgi:hypothetical protein